MGCGNREIEAHGMIVSSVTCIGMSQYSGMSSTMCHIRCKSVKNFSLQALHEIVFLCGIIGLKIVFQLGWAGISCSNSPPFKESCWK